MSEQRIQRRLAAILAADVVGYSRLMEADEAGTLARLMATRRELFDPLTGQHNGRIFKTTGDGALVEFNSAVDAVNAAVAIQRALAEREKDAPRDRRIELRIGVALGDVIVEGDDLYGNGVNVAARLEGLAEPGSICISGNIYESVGSSIDVAYDDLGEQQVKNITRPVRAYRVNVDALPAAAGEASSEEAAAILKRPALAVLPFANMSGDPEQEYFADGLTEDIITALTLWRSFPVIARNSTFTYKGRSVKVQDVANELGVRYVIEGSVRKGGSRVRVTVQLIDAETGHHIWADRYDRELADIFDIQDEITGHVAATIVPELERAEHDRSVTKAPASLDAWDCYLRGVAYINDLALENIEKARDMFRRAIAIDPRYAKAHARLAMTYHRELWLEYAADRDEAARLLMESARRAVALDDADSMSHWVLALANVWPPLGDSDLAVREAERAREMNPADVDANFTCGSSLLHAERGAESIPHIETALRISPRDTRRTMFLTALGRSYLQARRPEDAERVSRECLREGGTHGMPTALRDWAHLCLISALGHQDRSDEAREVVERIGADVIAQRVQQIQSTFSYLWKFSGDDQSYIFEGLRKAGVDA